MRRPRPPAGEGPPPAISGLPATPASPLLRRLRVAGVTLVLAATSATPTTAAAMPDDHASRACALPAVDGVVMSEGFQSDQEVFLRGTGKVRALTLFVDFPDAPTQHSAADRYAEFFPEARDWFRTGSYGKLDYAPEPVLKYFRMPKNFSDYGIDRGYEWPVHEAMMRDLLSVADKEVDFSDYDLVNVLVTPNAGPRATQTVLSVTWTGASAATTDDGAVLDRVSVLYGHDMAGYRVLDHENGHIFGLPDLYSGTDFGETDHWAGQWDAMSLDWGMHSDYLAWHKWKLGWLDDGQVDCLAGPGTTTSVLSPVEVPGGKKMVVVPDGGGGAFAVEARSRKGNDARACSEGVLVYWLRTDVPSGAGPVRVVDAHPATSACESSSSAFNSLNDAPFDVGGRFQDPATGTRVEVLSKGGDGSYTVRVTKG